MTYDMSLVGIQMKDHYIQADTTGAVRLLHHEETVAFVQADTEYVEINDTKYEVDAVQVDNGAFIVFRKEGELVGTIVLHEAH